MSQIGAKDKMNVYQHQSFSVNYAKMVYHQENHAEETRSIAG